MVKVGKRFRGLGRDGRLSAAALGSDGGRGSRRASGSRRICCRPRSRRAACSARAMGPWSAGSGAVLLLNAAIDAAPGGSSVMVKGGPAALANAMAEAGARRGRPDPHECAGRAVILVRDGRATGVVLTDGTEILARRRRLERGSEADLPRPRRSDGSRSGLPDQSSQLPIARNGGQGAPRAQRRARSFEASRIPPTCTGACSSRRGSTTSSDRSTRGSTASCRRSRFSISRSRRSAIRRSRPRAST